MLVPRVVRSALALLSMATGATGATGATAQGGGRDAMGVVVGQVTDSAGRSVGNARAFSEGAEVRTDGQGRFILRDVPAGTRQVSVVALGHSPVRLVVDVIAGDTTRVSAVLAALRQLDAVDVRARSYGRLIARGIEERRKRGFGYVADSTTIGTHGTLASVFAAVPAVRIGRDGGDFLVMFPVRGQHIGAASLCVAAVWIDGQRSDYSLLNSLRPEDVAAVEVYTRWLILPMAFTDHNRGCGAIGVWTKRAFY